MSPESSLTVINPSFGNHQKEPASVFPETPAADSPAPSKLTPQQGESEDRKERADGKETETGRPTGHSDGRSVLAAGGIKPSAVGDRTNDFPDGNGDGLHAGANPLIEAIIERTETHPDQFDLGRRTAAHREQAGGNYAVPAPAGGSDGLATFGLFCLYDKRGKQPPKQGTKEHGQQRERVAEALRAYGYQRADPQLIEKAAEIHCERKGDWVNVFYKSFVADFGVALQDAEYFLKHGHLPDDNSQKGAPHGSRKRDNRSIAPGAVPRRVATEEEARAILGDHYGGP